MPDITIPLGDKINLLFDRLIPIISPITRALSNIFEVLVANLEDFLLLLPPLLIIISLSILAWWIAGKKLGVFSFLGLFLMYMLQLWSQTMSTLALVLLGTLISLLLAIPLGIWSSLNNNVEKTLRPVLDFMQTLPSFVYLIPAVVFFGLGKISAVVAIMIFAMPPPVRFTNLGIRQVPVDMIEAAQSFGSTRKQILFNVQLPLALPTIMAGINQCIMMSLSMAVIAAMIGAGGLGGEVLKAMQTVDIGLGVEGGLGIVLLAILLDRMTEKVSKNREFTVNENN